MIEKTLTDRVNAIQSTAEVIANTLKEMIYTAELKPGQPLVQETLARMFQVSRVPVRDALQILVKTGIAINVPRKGVIVRPLSRKHLDELFEIRKILEGAGVRKAVQRITSGRLRDLYGLIREQSECLKTSDVRRQEKLDDAFHRTLYEAADNATLYELIFSIWDRIKQARCTSTVIPAHGRRWIAESIKRHRKVLEAFKKRDEILAVEAVVEAIETSRQEITSCLEEMGWIESEKENGKEPT